MSKAFDTIDRSKLLRVMQNITDPDEVYLIHHLLYNTTIQVGLGKLISEPFESKIGTPQGDGLSPILFVCYLEAAMQECHRRLPNRPSQDELLPQETGYADDVSTFSAITLERLVRSRQDFQRFCSCSCSFN